MHRTHNEVFILMNSMNIVVEIRFALRWNDCVEMVCKFFSKYPMYLAPSYWV